MGGTGEGVQVGVAVGGIGEAVNVGLGVGGGGKGVRVAEACAPSGAGGCVASFRAPQAPATHAASSKKRSTHSLWQCMIGSFCIVFILRILLLPVRLSTLSCSQGT